MIKDFIASSIHWEQEDFDLVPFNQYGGLGKFYQVFGSKKSSKEKLLSEKRRDAITCNVSKSTETRTTPLSLKGTSSLS